MKCVAVAVAVLVVASAIVLASPLDRLKLASKKVPTRTAVLNKEGKAPMRASFQGADAPDFFISAYGGSFKPYPNTKIASLWDIQSQDFVKFYNWNKGIPADPNMNMDGCCVISIGEGYLTIRKNVEDPTQYGYIAPFTSGGTRECASQLTVNTEFGCVIDYGYCAGNFIGSNLTADIVSRFAYQPSINPAIGCQGTVQSFGVYKTVAPPPKYIVSGQGQTFPAPPKGYVIADINDIKSADFLAEYNAGKLGYSASGPMNGCCVFYVPDKSGGNNAGYLTETTQGGLSWWSMFTASGSFDCTTTPASPVGLGFAPGFGPLSGYVANINSTLTASMSITKTLDPSLGCGTPQDTFAFFKVKPAPPPAEFAVGGHSFASGGSYPVPVGYDVATLADVQSAAFAAFYNAGKLDWISTQPMDGCCLFRVATGPSSHGFLTETTNGAVSWWSAFTNTGGFDCSTKPSSPMGLGFAPGHGPLSGWVQTINSTLSSSMTAAPTIDPNLGCGTPAATFAIYKAKKLPHA